MTNNRILILGGSGFVGNTLYRELLSYFDVYGTYYSQSEKYADNHVFYRFDAYNDDLFSLLDRIKPGLIISAFNTNLDVRLRVYRDLITYLGTERKSRLIVFSSSSVFDARTAFPAYETDRPVSQTEKGKSEIAIEKLLLEAIPGQLVIARVPIILGTNSPVIIKLREAIRRQAHFELYPNHIVSVTTADKLSQQIHYLINKERTGIFHLGSTDVIHHDELFKEIATGMSSTTPVFDYVYQSNDDCYYAILARDKKLPAAYRITVNQVIENTVLSDQITTLKN